VVLTGESVQQRLQERVKELTALHGTARLLQDAGRDLDEVMPAVVALLPPAWQHPASTEGQIRWQGRTWQTPGYVETPWRQTEPIGPRDGMAGSLTVIYTREFPPVDEGPFLGEERQLIRSLADMLGAYFRHRAADEAIVSANERLEREVAERTASLRRLAREVCLAEERERRHIAENLHDHLGQALALMKIRLRDLRGDAVLGGHGRALDELVSLSDQAIRYTRGLTFELSPPVLYELGLGPALEWLGDRVQAKEGLPVTVRARGRADLPDDLKVMLWKCVRELVHNVIKHAAAGRLELRLEIRDGVVRLTVADDGVGFDPEILQRHAHDRFGLLSIQERLRDYGGGLAIESRPGEGARMRLEAVIPKGEG
jgi:signal transduction histidine kinase